MNLKEIKEIIRLMNEHDLAEVEVEREGARLKIRKNGSETAPAVSFAPPQYRPESPAASEQPPAEEKGASASSSLVEIASPMVGTFYRAPAPDAPPFVDVGQMVEVGQVVCIVEAMKLMNEIKSEVRGRIVEVKVENADPVEFGQTLFLVESV